MDLLIKKLMSLSADQFEHHSILDLLHSAQLNSKMFSKFARFQPENYTRNLICKNENFELLLLCWEPGHITPIHDHSQQKCWMNVIEGIITSENYNYVHPLKFNGSLEKTSTECFISAESYYIDDEVSLHLLKNPIKNNQRTMTLHLYSKPFSSCTIYDVEKKESRKLEMRYHSISGKSSQQLASEISIIN
jgi:cysteine dioxygenase